MDILSRPVLRADHRIYYGPEPSQFGDLWIPEQVGGSQKAGSPNSLGVAPYPVVVFFHGGWWESGYDLGYAGYLCDALKREGIATWSVEYRRVGASGGGWPMTFQDAAHGTDFLSTLAKTYPLDLAHCVTMGHSAGGHLAFWVAGRHHIESSSELFLPRPQFGLRGAIALAGAVDLRLTLALARTPFFAHDRGEIYNLMGGQPETVPGRYRDGNPGELMPLQGRQVLIQGANDEQIPPELPALWAKQARRFGIEAAVKIVPRADHFDVVDPQSRAWHTVISQVKTTLYAEY